MTVPAVGRCYTINYDVPVGIDLEKDILLIALKTNHSFYVFPHESSLFALSMNPLVLPKYVQLDPMKHGGAAQALSIEAIRWQKLNRPESPCNSSPDYNFTDCVIESKARKVGCTLPWNKHIPGMLESCSAFKLITY